ncbi:MAG: hypothetical protein H7A51_10280 [Akkermansiaceae bacterium]|nr:hypothetical protein [Akkermansiaceae bacterium]
MQRQQQVRSRSPRRAGSSKPANRKQRLIRIAAVGVGILAFLVLGIELLAKSLITKGFLVENIEKSINSEVEIGDVKVSIFSLPAKVTLTDVSLAPKGTRSHRAAPIKIKETSLSVGLWGLLRKHVDVSNITISGAQITTSYHADGSTSLEKMFEAPGGKKRRSTDGGKGGGFNVFDQEDFVATLGGLQIKNSKVVVILEGMAIRLQCLDVEMDLSAIEIDPRQLAKTNSAKLRINSHIRIDSTKGWQYGDIYLSGESTTRIFNPVTGDAEPDVHGDFSLGKDSWLNTRIPFITRSWNHLSVLEKVGIKVAALPEKATFGRSEAIAAHYHLGKITVKKPLSIWVDDWELAALEDSWLQTQTDQHEVRAELLASKNASVNFRSVILKGVEFLPEQVQPIVAKDIEERLFRDQRLLVSMKSSGDFSDPTIRPVGVIMDFAEAAKEAAKKLLKEKAGGILDGILGGKKGKDE